MNNLSQLKYINPFLQMKFLSKEINPEGKVFMNMVLVSSLLTLNKYLPICDIYFVRTNETLTIRLIIA